MSNSMETGIHAPPREFSLFDDSHTAKTEDDWDAPGTGRRLKTLADHLYDLAVDICGFGPYAELQMTTRTGLGIDERLDAVRADLDTMLGQLRALRSEYLDSQLRRLRISADSGDLKLHIGCGTTELAGWINIGAYPTQLSMAATWDLPFKDASVEQVLVSRVPEALLLPIETRKFLREIYRVLVPKGVLQIFVDDLMRHSEKQSRSVASAYRNWADGRACRTRLDCMLSSLGALPSYSRGHVQHSRFELSALIYLLADEKFSEVNYTNSPSDAAGSFGTASTKPARERAGATARSYICARKPQH